MRAPSGTCCAARSAAASDMRNFWRSDAASERDACNCFCSALSCICCSPVHTPGSSGAPPPPPPLPPVPAGVCAGGGGFNGRSSPLSAFGVCVGFNGRSSPLSAFGVRVGEGGGNGRSSPLSAVAGTAVGAAAAAVSTC